MLIQHGEDQSLYRSSAFWTKSNKVQGNNGCYVDLCTEGVEIEAFIDPLPSGLSPTRYGETMAATLTCAKMELRLKSL
eukprot:4812474-Ditylum_brightwellii.AAC.1